MCKKKRDFTGSQFGRLTVLREAPKRPNSPNSVWVAACECGNEIEAFSHNLVAGRTNSCGCLKLERLKETAAKRVASVKAYWAKYRADNLARLIEKAEQAKTLDPVTAIDVSHMSDAEFNACIDAHTEPRR